MVESRCAITKHVRPSRSYDAIDVILFEKKSSIKVCGLASPNSADAFVITFAAPVPLVESTDWSPRFI